MFTSHQTGTWEQPSLLRSVACTDIITVKVLVISPVTDDHLTLGRIFSHSRWEVHYACTYAEALEQLYASTVPVILTDCDVPPFSWKDVLNSVADVINPPRLIVASENPDARLWGEALNLGAYDVLSKPFDSKELFQVISAAWRDWKHHEERNGFLRCRTAQNSA
jgi:DNA-binding NtrC family response regulator